MKKRILALMTAGLVLASGLSASAEDAPRGLTVSGTGSVTAEADTATLDVIIETSGKTAEDAARANANTAARVRNAAIAAGASSEEIATANYILWPEYDPKHPETTAAWHVQNAMRVRVNAVSAAGKVSDAAVAAGASRISAVNFQLRDDAPYRTRALRLAADAAHEKALRIAEDLGVSLGGVLSASVNSVRAAAPRAPMDTVYGARAGTELTPDRQDITADVTLIYEIL